MRGVGLMLKFLRFLMTVNSAWCDEGSQLIFASFCRIDLATIRNSTTTLSPGRAIV
jgi:hypothetical protein